MICNSRVNSAYRDCEFITDTLQTDLREVDNRVVSMEQTFGQTGSIFTFLDAPSYLYESVCLSIHGSIRQSICQSVRRSGTPSLRRVLGASALFIFLTFFTTIYNFYSTLGYF